MKAQDGNMIQEVFHKALALPESQRNAFVAKACTGNPDLEREVKELLRAHDSCAGFLGSPVVKLDFLPENLAGITIDGRYRVEKKLGESAMSQVYFARALRLQNQPVVVKVLSRVLVQDADARRRFDQEVEALLRIEHPNVVRVLDTEELPDGRPYIVMTYVDGETLRSQIPNEGMNLERAASMLEQIGPALDHVHEQKIFHRDLKPENIMIRRGADSVVLIDFGIAKVRDSLVAPSTVNGASAGTLLYMSPEQLRNERVTAESDIYSMAVIAYEMVIGRRPFNATTPSQLADMQRAGVRAKAINLLRPNLPRGTADVIARGLSFKPKRRHQRAGQFSSELACALNKEAKGPWSPIWWRLAIAGALLILLSVAVLFAFYKYDGGPTQVGPNRSFKYWLTVQKMRDGKEYQAPFQSNGEDKFDGGDKFRLSVLSPVPAYVYMINEGPPGTKDTSFRMIFPRLETNNGSGSLGANQTVESDWITFRGPEGDENFWIVWSVSPVAQLESAKTDAFKHPNGGLTGQNLVALKEFLRLKQLEVKVTVYHYQNDTAVARGRSDMLVTLAQFKHR